MSNLLSTHLAQISLCATSIADQPFAQPKIFTNALLSPHHDITALIRDTEQHERALFHLAPPPLASAPNLPTAAGAPLSFSSAASRRTTAAARQPKNKAVAAVLGGDLYLQTRQQGERREKKDGGGEVDVELLVRGAEKLVAVYPVPNAADRIAQLRRRHQRLEANLAHYEARVAEQTRELQAMNRPTSRSGYAGNDAADEADEATIPLTKEDLEREEEEIRELERKKKGLEERVSGMERDLGGLMR